MKLAYLSLLFMVAATVALMDPSNLKFAFGLVLCAWALALLAVFAGRDANESR